MHTMIALLNDILSRWKKQYDVTNAVALSFWVSDNFILHLNDLPVCTADPRDVSYAEFDARHIEVQFERAGKIEIFLFWPEDKPPKVSFARFDPAKNVS